MNFLFSTLFMMQVLVASLLVDHFGVLGFPQQSITLTKLLGAGLLFAGVLLVAR
mgnify:CR=1 FL=1